MTSDALVPSDERHGSIDARIVARDLDARRHAVDPRFNVALEASAGTGKTRVLVDRYINLLRAGVDPANVLAITFTRKAAAEMRDRIMVTLRQAAERGEIPATRWRALRDRTADIAICTIDAFCLSLLREFPLEADLDPGFAVADDTELPRLVDEALDHTLRICRAAARSDEDVAVVFARLGERRIREGMATLLDRRLVAPAVLTRYVARWGTGLDGAAGSRRAATALVDFFASMRGGLERFVDSGPVDPSFELAVGSLRRLSGPLPSVPVAPHAVHAAYTRLRALFLTQDGRARRRPHYPKQAFANAADWKAHSALVAEHADAFERLDAAYRRDLNALVARGFSRMFRIADAEYRRTLDAHALLDFPDLVLRTLELLRRMEEFSRSRYRLESRYHHLLVDEFQDTSRAQWELISLLVQSWGEGAGLADTGPLHPSIFIVGDRKQSIYGFRDADVSVLREAARHIGRLRGDTDARRSMSRSFRASPPLLAFVNDVCRDMDNAAGDRAFRYEEIDRFPVDTDPAAAPGDALGVVPGATSEACADITASEIARLLAGAEQIRDRDTGLTRDVRPGDVAILFRSRDSHRDFERALTRREIPSYVYKGLGFFDADEIKDALALIRYLAHPASDLRTAALLRSRVFGMSDDALRSLVPGLADAVAAPDAPAAARSLDPVDAAALAEARVSTARWRRLVDTLGVAELVDVVLAESAYAVELRGPRVRQARENLKKLRALLRRLHNRGYATMARVAAHLDRIAVGDEANAVVDAREAVNLMTVHASKGLEFPVVFVVNLERGTGSRRGPVRWSPDVGSEEASVAVGESGSEVDEQRDESEREETKRLVYVALTRARDRLYLSSWHKEGRVVPARGSLAEVMPQSLTRLLGVPGGDVVHWQSSSGAVHRLRVCSSDTGRVATVNGLIAPAAAGVTASAFRPLAIEGGPFPHTSPSAAMTAYSALAGPRWPGDDAGRLVGAVVHRMLQRFGFRGVDADAPIELDAVGRMIRAMEGATAADRTTDDLAREAIGAYRAICARADIRALYGASEVLHELPFSMRVGDTVVRGTIDCLLRTSAGRLTVLEFKTGRPSEAHRVQLDLYRRAAERMFPGAVVDARLVYARGEPTAP